MCNKFNGSPSKEFAFLFTLMAQLHTFPDDDKTSPRAAAREK